MMTILIAWAGFVLPDETTVRVSPKHEADRVRVETRDDRVVVSVTLSRGIGGATLRSSGERWPSRIVVRLLGIKGLEGLKISDGTVTIAASVTRQVGPIAELLREGRPGEPIGADSPYGTEIKVCDDGFEFVLPRAMLDAKPRTIALEWIDFYR